MSLRVASKARRTSQILIDRFKFAGPGIEPGSGGYEPPEIPLLYPAVMIIIAQSSKHFNLPDSAHYHQIYYWVNLIDYIPMFLRTLV